MIVTVVGDFAERVVGKISGVRRVEPTPKLRGVNSPGTNEAPRSRQARIRSAMKRPTARNRRVHAVRRSCWSGAHDLS